MKRNLPVTGKENLYPAHYRLVSTTDTHGKITYANRDFIEVSGFTTDELTGASHNIVRHPDIPPEVFADLWRNLKAGKSWMGVIKNRCKNGDHYWVDAFVTPVLQGSQVIGYQSVRIKPSRELIAAAEVTFQNMGRRPAPWQQIGLAGKMLLACMGSGLAGLIAHWATGSTLLALGVVLVSSLLLAFRIARPWQQAAEQARQQFDNPIARKVYTRREDELGQLQLMIAQQRSLLETVVWRVRDSTGQLDEISQSAAARSAQTRQAIDNQSSAINQVSQAMAEMDCAVQEVAQNAAQTALSAKEAQQQAGDGRQRVNKTTEFIGRLAEEVQHARTVVAQLAAQSQQIGGVVNTIRNIAEQTNLLALNAAIEAARAGDQGRGFAVVATEVRNLAGLTQSSTEEIYTMIADLQKASDAGVQAMESSGKAADEGVEQASLMDGALEVITTQVNGISAMIGNIAAAAEEQSAVAANIRSYLDNMRNLTGQTQQTAVEADQASDQFAESVQKLNTMAKQFGI